MADQADIELILPLIVPSIETGRGFLRPYAAGDAPEELQASIFLEECIDDAEIEPSFDGLLLSGPFRELHPPGNFLEDRSLEEQFAVFSADVPAIGDIAPGEVLTDLPAALVFPDGSALVTRGAETPGGPHEIVPRVWTTRSHGAFGWHGQPIELRGVWDRRARLFWQGEFTSAELSPCAEGPASVFRSHILAQLDEAIASAARPRGVPVKNPKRVLEPARTWQWCEETRDDLSALYSFAFYEIAENLASQGHCQTPVTLGLMTNPYDDSLPDVRMDHSSAMFLPVINATNAWMKKNRVMRRIFSQSREAGMFEDYEIYTETISVFSNHARLKRWGVLTSRLGPDPLSRFRRWRKPQSRRQTA